MKILAAGALLWLSIVAASLGVAARQPWLGLGFTAPTGQPGLVVVAEVDPDGPAASRLHPGDVVTGLRGPGSAWLELSAADLDPEPTYLHRYAELDRFLQRQQAIASLLRQDTLSLRLRDGREIAVEPRRARPWSALPGLLMLQAVLLTGLAFAISLVCLQRQPKDWAARYFVANALGFACLICPYAIYSTRELALPAILFRTLLAINNSGGLVFVAGSAVALLWHYPAALSRKPAAPWIYGVAILFAAVHELRLHDTQDLGLRLPSIVSFAAQITVAALQWHRAAGWPARRAVLKWLVVPWFGCAGLYMLLLMIPASTQLGPQAPQIAGWILFLFIFIGLALGLTRFRLYYLNPAILLVWFIDGVLVVGLIAAQIKLGGLQAFPACCIAIALAGLVHGAIRDTVWAAQGLKHADFERVLRIVLGRLEHCRSERDVAAAWHGTLQTLFEPRLIQTAAAGISAAAILDDGERLRAPAGAGSAAIVLAMPYRGRGLFMPQDVRLVDSVWQMFEAVGHYWDEHGRGQAHERGRLARELEILLDRQLANLAQVGASDELKRLAVAARAELQRVSRTLREAGLGTHQILSQWQSEVAERCAAAGLQYQWQLDEALLETPIAEEVLLKLHGILREATTNVIRHSGASLLRVTVALAAPERSLLLCVEDDGIGLLEAPPHRRGLNNMESRASELGGQLQLARSALGGLRVGLSLALTRTGDGAAPAVT